MLNARREIDNETLEGFGAGSLEMPPPLVHMHSLMDACREYIFRYREPLIEHTPRAVVKRSRPTEACAPITHARLIRGNACPSRSRTDRFLPPRGSPP